MRKSLFASYLPFSLAVIAVAILAFGLDYQTRSVNRTDLRAEIQAEAEILRARLESQIEGGILITRGVASLLSREEDLSQGEFSRLVRGVTEGRADVINVAWAPDLVITRVHPVEPNRAALGVDYRQIPAQLDAIIRARDTGQIAFVGPVDLVQGGKGFIMRVPVYTVDERDFEFEGILSTVFELDLFLQRVGLGSAEQTIEVALARLDDHGLDQDLFYGAPELTSDSPVSAEVHFAEGTWRLYARPIGGWAAATDRLIYQRLLLLLLSAFILVPLYLVNRMALSRQKIIRDMELADDRLSSFISNFPGVFFTYVQEDGQRDKIDFITEACRDIWNASPEAIYDHPGILWNAFDPEKLPEFQQEVERSRREGSTWNFIWRSTTRDGTARWLEGWGHPYHYEAGLTRWDCFVVDITAQQAREEAFEQQAEIMRQAQKQESIGQLTGGMAHDFNNMLAVIRGNMEMLEEDLTEEAREDDERLEFVRGAILAAERGNDLTKKMLSFARRARLDPEELNLNDIVRELEGWSGRTLPATITLRKELTPDLPLVRLDRSSTASALLNMMVNARDAMPEGGVLTIATKTATLDAQDVATMPQDIAPGDYVVVSLQDTGEGIAKDKLETIFEPFYTTKGPGAGSGLGLSMVHGFIAQSGGAIRVTSELGQGTKIELFFQALHAQPSKEDSEAALKGTSADAALSILVAEDDPDVRDMLERSLTRMGHAVTTAEDGDAALALFDGGRVFDLLLTDIVMPGSLQGTALVEALRQRRPGFPAIVMTGYTDVPLHEGSVLHPDDIRLSKPVARAELERAIHDTMSRL
ncbi:CHASE domain-containing protein [Thalassovita sp.]|uniref:CHASE domain-containing protein n=1 Tax=Thalassovita sp. TaxID=1979401 RepID=UPI002AAF0DCF|nr:CHASE domain-containing protein [Thalassovita sp.]